MDLKKHIRSITDYPKKGILFRDITTLIKDAEAFKYTNDKIVKLAKKIEFDKLSLAFDSKVKKIRTDQANKQRDINFFLNYYIIYILVYNIYIII